MFHITSAWQTTSQQQQPKWLQISRTVPNVVLVLPNHGPACLHKCPAAFISEPQDFVPSSEKYKVLDTQVEHLIQPRQLNKIVHYDLILRARDWEKQQAWSHLQISLLYRGLWRTTYMEKLPDFLGCAPVVPNKT